MPKNPEPTNRQNAASRLFLRFLLCYLLALPIGILLAVRQLLDAIPEATGTYQLLFVALSLLGALLTVTKPFLLLLTVFKAFYDAALLYRITQLTRAGAIGILPWNICFFLTAFTVILYALSASRAERFTFFHPARDLKLIFSRPFGGYLVEALLLLALALCFYTLWPQIYESFGLMPSPFE